MTRDVTFTSVYSAVEDGWVQATIREIPEVITVARSHEEAREMLLDALIEYLRALGTGSSVERPTHAISEETLEISVMA